MEDDFMSSLGQGLRIAAGGLSQNVYNQQQKQDEMLMLRKFKFQDEQLANEQNKKQQQAKYIADSLASGAIPEEQRPQAIKYLQDAGFIPDGVNLGMDDQAKLRQAETQQKYDALGRSKQLEEKRTEFLSAHKDKPPTSQDWYEFNMENAPASTLGNFKAPTTAAPHTRNVIQGSSEIQQELLPDGTWRNIGSGPRFARSVPAGGGVGSGSGGGGGGGVAPATSDDRQSKAAMVATGMPLNQVIPGFGKSAVSERQQARSDAIKQIIQETGKDAASAGIELANRSIDFQSGKKSSGQLTTMYGATKQSVDQLDMNIENSRTEMKKLKSSNISPVLNSIARGYQKWTGDPAYSSLFYYLSGVGVEAARLRSGGQASIAQLHQGAADEAQQWINMNLTPASAESVFAAIKNEGHQKLQSYSRAIDSQRVGTKTQKPGADPSIEAILNKYGVK